MICCKLLRYDLRHGLLRYGLVAVPLLFAATCISMYSMSKVFAAFDGSLSTSTVTDYVLYCFRGTEPIRELHSLEQLQLPLLWLSCMGLCLLLNLLYPLQDISHFGQQIIVRSGSRVSWWASKCIWNIISCALYYALALSSIILMALLLGAEFSLAPSADFIEVSFPSVELTAMPSRTDILRCILVQPLLTLCTLSLLEMLLSLFIKPVFSLLCSMTILIASVYFFSPFLPGNYAMLLRSALFCTDGLTFKSGMWILPMFSIAACLAGAVFFKSWDILNIDQ